MTYLWKRYIVVSCYSDISKETYWIYSKFCLINLYLSVQRIARLIHLLCKFHLYINQIFILLNAFEFKFYFLLFLIMLLFLTLAFFWYPFAHSFTFTLSLLFCFMNVSYKRHLREMSFFFFFNSFQFTNLNLLREGYSLIYNDWYTCFHCNHL